VSHKAADPPFSVRRLLLSILNVPIGLVAFYVGVYSFTGLWNPDTPIPLWLWAGAQPAVALVFWLSSAAKWRGGDVRTGNLLLLLPLASLVAWIAAMQIWIRVHF
jgi:hypothetical protein